MLTEYSSRPEGSEEETLAVAACAGDRGALETLFRRFYSPVYSLCLRLLARDDQAHDCAQETFLRLIRAAVPYKARGHLGSWLLRIATNLCIDRLRRHSLEPLPAALDDHSAPVPIGEGMDIDRVRKCVAGLPAAFRPIIVLRLEQSWEYREIAETLGISENLARVRFFRALGMLREMLQ